MINITPICKQYERRPNAWLTNEGVRERVQPKVTRGKQGKVLIAEQHLLEFLLWLDKPATTFYINTGLTPEQVLINLKETS